jgi:hypothetical protein
VVSLFTTLRRTYRGRKLCCSWSNPRAAGLHFRAEDESQKLVKVTEDNMVVLMKLHEDVQIYGSRADQTQAKAPSRPEQFQGRDCEGEKKIE